MRLQLSILLATVLAFGGGAALANRPAAVLPNGDVVDLNTGVAAASDGHHYRLSPAELQSLREDNGLAPAPPDASAPASASTTGGAAPPQ